MRIPKIIVLPKNEAEDLDELKKVVKELTQAVENLHRVIYGDLAEIQERLVALEP